MEMSKKIKKCRERFGYTQKQVSKKIGLDDSTLSALENGKIEPKISHLELLAKLYGIPLSNFFDLQEPLCQRVLWRNEPKKKKEILVQFLGLCEQFHRLEIWTDSKPKRKLPNIVESTSEDFGYLHAEILADKARRDMGLGDCPGQTLFTILEEVFEIKIFFLDLADNGIAASAKSESFGYAILLNSNCSRWRRNHDLAHELFHLLTWELFDYNQREPNEMEEKLATCFAGNVLLPTEPLKESILRNSIESKLTFDTLDDIARQFDVSIESLLWRMHFLYKWDEDKTKERVSQSKEYIKNNRRDSGPEPSTYPEKYKALASKALRDGEISLGRFANYMGIGRSEAKRFLARESFNYGEIEVVTS
jgi:Zn-dependent peptidase ImmA (M78 family)/transcriptional regulator with XRE-family HTH domain